MIPDKTENCVDTPTGFTINAARKNTVPRINAFIIQFCDFILHLAVFDRYMIAGRTPLFCDLVTILSNMPTAQSAQQLLRQLDKNWTSFFAAIKDWKLNKGKYTGMPRLPKYKRKDGRCQLTVTNQNCTLMENGTIQFPKLLKGNKLWILSAHTH